MLIFGEVVIEEFLKFLDIHGRLMLAEGEKLRKYGQGFTEI